MQANPDQLGWWGEATAALLLSKFSPMGKVTTPLQNASLTFKEELLSVETETPPVYHLL